MSEKFEIFTFFIGVAIGFIIGFSAFAILAASDGHYKYELFNACMKDMKVTECEHYLK